jgi:hypothetical protein
MPNAMQLLRCSPAWTTFAGSGNATYNRVLRLRLRNLQKKVMLASYMTFVVLRLQRRQPGERASLVGPHMTAAAIQCTAARNRITWRIAIYAHSQHGLCSRPHFRDGTLQAAADIHPVLRCLQGSQRNTKQRDQKGVQPGVAQVGCSPARGAVQDCSTIPATYRCIYTACFQACLALRLLDGASISSSRI